MSFHDWEGGTGISPGTLNEHLRKPLLRARHRRKDFFLGYGLLATVGSYAANPSAVTPYKVSILADGRPLIVMANLPCYSNTSAHIVYIDVLCVELGIWISSNTATQNPIWLGRKYYNNLNYINALELFYPWIPPITEEQQLTFQLYLGASSPSSWVLAHHVGYSMFGVMEA